MLGALMMAGLCARAPADTPPAGPPPAHTGVKATLKAIPRDFAHIPSQDTLIVLGIGASLTVFVHPFDYDVNEHLKGAHSFFVAGKYIGSAPVQAALALGTYAFGRATDNRVVSHLGMDLVRSTIEVGALTYGLKAAFGRERPTGECCAFPSGHASVTFASATVLQRHLGWKAALPTYTVATYVAMSRLHENRHWLSDVVGGATLGLIVGRTVTRHGRANYTLAPMPVPGGIGLMVAYSGR